MPGSVYENNNVIVTRKMKYFTVAYPKMREGISVYSGKPPKLAYREMLKWWNMGFNFVAVLRFECASAVLLPW